MALKCHGTKTRIILMNIKIGGGMAYKQRQTMHKTEKLNVTICRRAVDAWIDDHSLMPILRWDLTAVLYFVSA